MPGQQTRRRVVAATNESGLDREHAEFVAIHPGGVRLVMQTGAKNMHHL